MNMDFHFFRKKARHKVTDFALQHLKAEVYRVRTAKRDWAYEIDVLVRHKYDFKKAGNFKQEDSLRLIDLLRLVDRYVNGHQK